MLKSREWRLDNLYSIQSSEGKKIPFVRNWAQRDFFSNIWYFNVVLKARQLGFSTFILLYMLDACLFNNDHSCGVVAQSLQDAQDLFDNKIKFAYDNLDPFLKKLYPAVEDSARKLSFTNGSSIVVGNSLRSGTFQKLHVSELGKIAAKYPDKAKEVRTGALNTIHIGQQIFIESTAEGQGGEFYDLCERAKKIKEMALPLTPLDPRFHFYPWYLNPDYKLDPLLVHFTKEDDNYFRELAVRGIMLSREQKAWYVKKAEQQGDEMKREFPSTPEEAFEAAVEGAYYSKQMGMLRRKGHFCRLPHDPSYPVSTFWDIGRDKTPIWFMQHVGKVYHFIDYYENSNEDISHYGQILADYREQLGYVYKKHYWPHDGPDKGMYTNDDLKLTAKKHGIKPIKVVPRTNDLKNDVQAVKNKLPLCYFDIERCAQGIKGLNNYRKEWDEQLAVWKDRPRHDDASHPEAAFRTFVLGYKDDDRDDDEKGSRDDYHDEYSKPSDEWEDM